MSGNPEHMFAGTGLLLFDIWRSIPRREGETLPHWQDVKAGHLTAVMKDVWVLEHVPPGAMIVRFMGSEVGHWAGQDTTGQDFLKTRIAPDMRNFMFNIYETTYRTPCGTQLTRVINLPGKNPKEMRTTFFPLRFESAVAWGLLGCSDMRSTDDDILLGGSADFAGSTLLPPQFIDIGFGLPKAPPQLETGS